jgi:hypothetical protein
MTTIELDQVVELELALPPPPLLLQQPPFAAVRTMPSYER